MYSRTRGSVEGSAPLHRPTSGRGRSALMQVCGAPCEPCTEDTRRRTGLHAAPALMPCGRSRSEPPKAQHQVKHADGTWTQTWQTPVTAYMTAKTFNTGSHQSACHLDFPGGTVGENPSAYVGDTASIPGLGRFHRPRGKEA